MLALRAVLTNRRIDPDVDMLCILVLCEHTMSVDDLLTFLSAHSCMLVATEIDNRCRMDVLVVASAKVAIQLVVVVLIVTHGSGRHTDDTCTGLKLLVLMLVVRIGIDCILGVHTELRVKSAAS